MRILWDEIGFTPTSFELPASIEENYEHDQPISESQNFPRKTNYVEETNEIIERYDGLTIANFNLEVEDDKIKKFVISAELEEDKINIIREKKKAVATITQNLTSNIIKQAMENINFSNCKTKFFGLPLYCRPLREITPEKKETPSPTTPKST